MRTICIFGGFICAIGALFPLFGQDTCKKPKPAPDAFGLNKILGRGVNLGNALDAPKEGAWGFTIRDEYFSLIKNAGFDSVRIPVRWSAHAKAKAPFTIDADLFRRVDHLVDEALTNKLAVVLNVHHYDEIHHKPNEHKGRLLGLWKQIAGRYAKKSDRLFFEILNEPNGKLTAKLWNGFLADALAVIRRANPERMVIIGPAGWNNLAHLNSLDLPEKDRRLIATFHYYSPFEFTHQGAEWSKDSRKWLGRKWEGKAADKKAVVDDFDKAAKWAKSNKRPLYLGEFGAYSKADLASRARWTRFVREEAEKRGMSFAYWEFGAGFGVYDPAAKKWHEPLREALVPKPAKSR
jgi:endoglucanase